MDIAGSVALVTGANRGLGREFARELLARGARRVYATARRPGTVDLPGVEVLPLDVADADSIAAVAARAGDVELLVNNAGVSTRQNLVRGDLAEVRREMETNFFGPLQVTRAFADGLVAHGGGAVVNVLSALSWFAWDGATSYSASKAAAWMLTQATRVDPARPGTQVLGVHLGAADTDMMKGYDGPLLSTSHVVRTVLDGLANGADEVLLDDWSRTVKAGLAEDPGSFYARIAAAAGR